LSRRFAYVYLMKDDPERVRAAVAGHVSYWRRLRLDGYVGGPFADRSGGLITFEADDEEHAGRVVASDPFVVEGLLATHWLKRWAPE
jgi:uncharacterized protein